VNALRTLIACRRGGTAAEFALLLPLSMLFLFGIIDVGRFGWDVNRAEKATQTGARWAVATDIIPGGNEDDGLKNYSFTVGSGVPQGTIVPASDFPEVSCQTDGSSPTSQVACSCDGCAFSVTIDSTAQAAWDAMIARMQAIDPAIGPQNVRIDYSYSGLGFAGDPNGADVAPIVTVSLRTDDPATRLTFHPLTLYLFHADLPLPSFSYSLTMEDGDGTYSN